MINSGFAKKPLPESWPTLGPGHIKVHPEHKDAKQTTPVEVFAKDPQTYVPDPSLYSNGFVLPWGLNRPDDDDVGGDAFLRDMWARQAEETYYRYYDSPIVQFVKVLERRKLDAILSESVQEAMNSTLTIKISLGGGCEEYCWRRIKVPAGIQLSALHDQVICPVMGWSRGYHGYVFQDPKDGTVLGPAKYSGYIDMMHSTHYYYIMDDRDTPLAAIVGKVGDICYYTYDLGDSWEHKIEVEEVTQSETSEVVLLEGKGACPPEDSNGLSGMGNGAFKKFLEEYKKHPMKASMKQVVRDVERSAVNYTQPWALPAPKFKPFDFDIDRHRKLLTLMLAGPAVKRKEMMDGHIHSMKGCLACGDRIKALKRCSRCHWAGYCSRECQAKDWKTHKPNCKPKPK